LFTQKSQSQQLELCSGNSGNAIFTEDFDTGVTNSPLTAGGTTTYTYAPTGFPDNGEYTVRNNSIANGLDWHQLSEDHTIGDTNGKFLIVQADQTPGEFYQNRVSGLCEATTYEFSAWVINLVIANSFCSGQPGGTIPINVRFEIWDSTNTNRLAFGDTGNIVETSSPIWQEYGLVFQTLAGQNDIVLKMINNGQGGCGNDLAIDDIEFKTCGDLTIIEDASNNTNISICSNQTPYTTTLIAVPDNSVFSTHFYQWQESSDGITWNDIVGETSQNILISGLTSAIFYRSKVSESSTTVNELLCNTLSDVYQVTVDAATTPTFTQVSAICSGDSLSPLLTTSNEGVLGTWSPALNNTVTTTYTFTPEAGQCATNQNMTITVNPIVNPTFTQVAPICKGDTIMALPSTSIEGILGSWLPVIDNTTTTTYTFTPDTGQCATSETMTILVNTEVTPSFTQVLAICSGDSLSALPTTSNEGIVGTWSPVLDNMSSTTYTFTPDTGQCASNQTMTITVNPIITPTFNQVTPICIGEPLASLSTTSNEGITGSWSPVMDNMLTTTYTFTPGLGQCAVNQTMTITVNPNQAPVFNPVLPICNGETLAPLPTISLNGIPGTWSPDLNNTVTKTYTFIPDAGFCPSTFNLTITVNDNPSFSLQEEYFLCFEQNGNLAFPTLIDTGLNPTMYNFRWLLNGLEISGASQGTYSPIEGGSYEVVVQNNLTGCSSTEVTEVIPLYQPEFEPEVITAAFSENPIIQVSTMSSGDFEYQLDDSPWQDEPFFDNVSIGEHNVKVRDKRGCIESSQTLIVIGYPKFFTPNDDGSNDSWNINSIADQVNARIYIFDRYGKLLKQINPAGEGWSGIYNGELMPVDDYWFILEYNDANTGERKMFKAHFTLKR